MIDLLLIILVPVIGGGFCALLPRRYIRSVKWWALGFSLLTLFFAIGLAVQFKWSTGEELSWSSELLYVKSLEFGLKLGADSISLWLVLLTVLLTPLAIAASFTGIRERQKEYY